MDANTRQLIENAEALYKPIVVGEGCRIRNGNQLWKQFLAAVGMCAKCAAGGERQLLERINELATAKVLAEDQDLHGVISYELDLLPSGRKIDFVAERERDNLYVEVKTVRPEALDNEETWARYLSLSAFHPNNVNFIVSEDGMGGMIYANAFASRSKFLQYSLAFEKRLAEVQSVKAGPGVLVFCGTGFAWDVSDLEDFSDYYHSGHHREDDPFALMEQHEIDAKGIDIQRNISYFAFIKRHSSVADVQRVCFPVRGPTYN
ncbi:MAG: hypothetical protein QNL16_04250 [Rhodobacterales bacterium]|jgi:hypothetical protein|nr:hypothetical protein [Pseudomonadota bacterium]MDA1285947.1 hypothetical protein [Pseudomonadota bacterium]